MSNIQSQGEGKNLLIIQIEKMENTSLNSGALIEFNLIFVIEMGEWCGLWRHSTIPAPRPQWRGHSK